MAIDDDTDELRLAWVGFPVHGSWIPGYEESGGGSPDGIPRGMTPEELAAEQQQRDEARAAEIFERRAHQLFHDLGHVGVRGGTRPWKECRKLWPKLSDDDVDATVERARAISAEYAERKRLLAEENAERLGRTEPDPEELEEIETTITNNGRRLEGAELKGAIAAMATKSKGEMTAAAAREFAASRLREQPEISCVKLHKEAQDLGYGGEYSSFYTSVYKKAQARIAADAAEAAATDPAPAAAAEEAEARVPAAEPPADALVVTDRAPTASTPPAFDPAAGSGTFLILALQASRHDGGTRITVTVDADGDANDAILNLTRRLRGAAVA